MNCIHCDRSAHAACRFCGRAVCKDHFSKQPFIVGLYQGEDRVPKAIVVRDAIFCGLCHPHEQPIPLPELA